jgi:hypothetical protein
MYCGSSIRLAKCAGWKTWVPARYSKTSCCEIAYYTKGDRLTLFIGLKFSSQDPLIKTHYFQKLFWLRGQKDEAVFEVDFIESFNTQVQPFGINRETERLDHGSDHLCAARVVELKRLPLEHGWVLADLDVNLDVELAFLVWIRDLRRILGEKRIFVGL